MDYNLDDNIEQILSKQLDNIKSLDIKEYDKKTDIEPVEQILSDLKTKAITNSNDELLSKLIDLQEMITDYKRVRVILLDNVENTQKLASSLTRDLFDDPEVGADKISAYSSLINSINSSVKILASSYKDISSVLLNIKKLQETNDNPKEVNFNDVQNVNIISTNDIINKLRESKN